MKGMGERQSGNEGQSDLAVIVQPQVIVIAPGQEGTAFANGHGSPVETSDLLEVHASNGDLHNGSLSNGTLSNGGLQHIPRTPTPYGVYTTDDGEQISFRPFTEESFQRLLIREAQRKAAELEKQDRVNEGRLVDGELKWDEEEEEETPTRNPALVEGNNLSDEFDEAFPKELLGKAIEEIDSYLTDKTFVVVTKRFNKKYIHRFSATKAFFILSPWNKLRKFAILIATNQIFDYFIIMTILVNCVFLALKESYVTNVAEYVFLTIYSFEAIIKLLARGFILNTYTYLRDAWNWLDFTVIITAYLTLILQRLGQGDNIGGIVVLRTFRVLRALKTISIVPGLKTIIAALLKAIRMLAEVIILTLFCLMVFALFALQVYAGVLRHKCVRDPEVTVNHQEWAEHVKDPVNWYPDPVGDNGDFLLCGNNSRAGSCPANYSCLPNLGDNPNFGYTNFDHFGWSMLNSFQLITLDFWEDPYNKIIRANGPWNVMFFVMVVFNGSFYLINLILAVVSMSYEEEASFAGKEKEKQKKLARKKELYNTARLKEAARAKALKDSEDEKGTANHLQVIGNVDSLHSSNGHLKTSSSDLTKEDHELRVMVSPPSPSRSVRSHTSITSSRTSPNLNRNGKKTEQDNGSPYIKWTATDETSEADRDRDTIAMIQNEHNNEVAIIDEVPMQSEEQAEEEARGTIHDGREASVSSEDDTPSISSENPGDGPVIVIQDDDEELTDRNCGCCGKCCVCYIPWLRGQGKLYHVVNSFVFEMVSSVFIALNVAVLAMAYHGMSPTYAKTLEYLNIFFTAVFTLEAVLKIVAMPKYYFKVSWNIFDFIIVIASLLDLAVDYIDGLDVIRVIRLLRLLRVFKLAQTWSTMRVLLSIIFNTLGALGNLSFILLVVMYIFAVFGMQIFSNSYTPEKFGGERIPRWNFTDFWHSLMLIFRILCGEWIEPLWDCMRAAGQVCMVVFLPTLIFGNFVVLNLFLALMLNSFATDSINKNKEKMAENKKMKQGWNKLKGIFKSKQKWTEEELIFFEQAIQRELEKEKLEQLDRWKKRNVIILNKPKKRVDFLRMESEIDPEEGSSCSNHCTVIGPYIEERQADIMLDSRHRTEGSQLLGSDGDSIQSLEDDSPQIYRKSHSTLCLGQSFEEEDPNLMQYPIIYVQHPSTNSSPEFSPRPIIRRNSYVQAQEFSLLDLQVNPEDAKREKEKPSMMNVLEALKKKKLEEEKEKRAAEGNDKDVELANMSKNDNEAVLKKSVEADDNQTGANGILKNMTSKLHKPAGKSTNGTKSNTNAKTEDSSSDEAENGTTSSESGGFRAGDTLEQRRKSIAALLNGARHKMVVGENEEDEDNDENAETSGEQNSETENKDVELADCFPRACYLRCCKICANSEESATFKRWHNFRMAFYRITEHKAFEYFVLIIIVLSSITLCFEDVHLEERPILKEVLYYLNIIFAVLFGIEMLMKWVAIGFKKYFTSFWTILDFCIVIISLISIAAESLGLTQINSFRALRTLRAFRPLRAISRWQGMRIVVNALMYAIPSIANVFLVILVFWLIFSIAGVTLFMGKFYKCVDSDGNKFEYDVIQNRSQCEALSETNGTQWVNAPIHFDNVFMGYYALFQVATFEGWMEIMEDATDITSVDVQPRHQASNVNYTFFVFFITFGSFFTLNLFIGVIIDNFNMLKKKYDGSYLDAFLTPSQKNYYNTMKKLGNRKPQKTIKRPKNLIQGFFYDVAVSNKFELAIVILIVLNMFAMAVEHYHQSEPFNKALDIVNIIFTTIFAMEAIVKIIGLRWHYFRRAWNVYDFIIVALSVIGVILDDLLANIFITPTLLRVVRVFRIGRVLRLIRAAKGVRKLLFALLISVPALFNIALLLLLIIFIYAIIGMTFFSFVKHDGALDDMSNFETFFNSMVLLFRLTTAAGWNDILEPLLNEKNCNNTHVVLPSGAIMATSGGDCSSSIIAMLYMFTYIFITYLIIINMYIAVILENFNQAHEQEEVGITEDDFEMFYLVWERYDPHATQFIKYEHLSDFVADLDHPLGIGKPNEIALVAFDLPIVEGDRLHCLDILIGLVKHVLGGVEDTDEFLQVKAQMEEKFRQTFPTRVTQVQISSTMGRKKEDVAARTLQRAWRKHKATKSIRKITEMAFEAKLNRSLARTSFSATSSQLVLSRPQSGASAQSKHKKMGNTLKVPVVSQPNLPSDRTSKEVKL